MDNEAGMFRMLRNLSLPDIHRLNLCFTCTALYSARARLQHNVPVYRYRYFGDWDNIRTHSEAGAFHGSELGMVFGTPKAHEHLIPSSPEQLKVEKLMMSAWAGFARDPVGYLKGLGWPLYRQGEKTLVRIAVDNKVDVDFVEPEMYDAECKTVYEPSNDALHSIMARSPMNRAGYELEVFSGPPAPKAKNIPT
jgi:hypothetical protein